MAFLNQQERDALLEEIRHLKVDQIKRRLRSKDRKSCLAFFRNVQETNRWMTRYILEGLGTQVTLVEELQRNNGRASYELVEIIVSPTPDNRL